MKEIQGERITLHGDGWGDADFFIKLALFEKTGGDKWTLCSAGCGPDDNRTDGEIDLIKFAYCVCSEAGDGTLNWVWLIPKFRVNANYYSYQSIYKAALESIPPKIIIKDFDKHQCRDRRAVEHIIREHYL